MHVSKPLLGITVITVSLFRTDLTPPGTPSALSLPLAPPQHTAHVTPSGTVCEQAVRLMPSAKSRPRLTLLPSNATVYLPYGRPSPLYLGACKNATDNATCGAVAWDVAPDGNATDVTASIVVRDVSNCSASGSKVRRCAGCCLAPFWWCLGFACMAARGLCGTVCGLLSCSAHTTCCADQLCTHPQASRVEPLDTLDQMVHPKLKHPPA